MNNKYVKTIEEAKEIWKEIPIGKSINTPGEKINHWTLLYKTKSSNRPVWVAQCDCGNIGKVRSGQSISKWCTDCQHKNAQRDYTGLRFGILTCTNERKLKNKKTYIKCICDCGNVTWVSNGNLTSGEVKSCGCLSHIYHGKKLEDLTGKIFNDLTVIELAFTKNGERYWHCKCKCGKEKNISTANLTTNKVKSCGCRKYLQINPGDRFGKLTVLSKIEGKYSSSGGILYDCKCDCGTPHHIVVGSRLIDGSIKSCGCGRNISYNEENINNLLSQSNIPFIREYQDKKLNEEYPTGGRKRSFDFYVNDSYIIEFDGSQHFKYTNTGWDTKEHFERTHKSDLIKNKYCFEHNIPLIRIPYDKDYTFEDLKLETTHFLLTPENEEKYYNDRTRT